MKKWKCLVCDAVWICEDRFYACPECRTTSCVEDITDGRESTQSFSDGTT